MRFPFPALLCVFAALALTACLRKDEPAAASATTPVVAGGPRVIAITVTDTMKYTVASIEAAPGEELKVVLTSTSSKPREEMAHNFVLLDKAADVEEFLYAATAAKADGFLPPALLGQMLAHTALLGPAESDTVVFKAPTAPGEYPYLCTFPGHYLTGMRGMLIVK